MRWTASRGGLGGAGGSKAGKRRKHVEWERRCTAWLVAGSDEVLR